MALRYHKTISLPLKREPAGVEQCPDEDRCQLEVVRTDFSDMVQVETAEDGSKLVKVGLIQEGGGCDYKVRVGVVKDTVGEYVYILIGSSSTGYWVTIFDTAAGATLDIDQWENVAGSEPKPAAIPCKRDTIFSDWFGDNFSRQTAATSLYGGVSREYKAAATSTRTILANSGSTDTDPGWCDVVTQSKDDVHPTRVGQSSWSAYKSGDQGSDWEHVTYDTGVDYQSGVDADGWKITNTATGEETWVYATVASAYNCDFVHTLGPPWVDTAHCKTELGLSSNGDYDQFNRQHSKLMGEYTATSDWTAENHAFDFSGTNHDICQAGITAPPLLWSGKQIIGAYGVYCCMGMVIGIGNIDQDAYWVKHALPDYWCEWELFYQNIVAPTSRYATLAMGAVVPLTDVPTYDPDNPQPVQLADCLNNANLSKSAGFERCLQELSDLAYSECSASYYYKLHSGPYRMYVYQRKEA